MIVDQQDANLALANSGLAFVEHMSSSLGDGVGERAGDDRARRRSCIFSNRLNIQRRANFLRAITHDSQTQSADLAIRRRSGSRKPDAVVFNGEGQFVVSL